MDGGGTLCPSVVQLLGDGRQGQEIVVLRQRFILLERLPSTAYHEVSAIVLQHILAGVGFMLIFHQPGGEGKMGGFHGIIAVIHSYGEGLVHLASPPLLFCLGLRQGARSICCLVSIKLLLSRQMRMDRSP